MLPMLRPHQSIDMYLKRFFRDSRVRLAFSFQSKYLGMSPFRCPSLFSILSFIEYEYGVFHPIGGCSAITAAMARLGVEIRLGEPVEEIVLKGRRAVGVRTAAGIELASAIVLNVDFARAISRLVPDGRRRRWTDRKIERKKFSCSTFMMYLGVEGSFDLPHHNIHIARLFVRNLALYRSPPHGERNHAACSVLLPARNEETNIGPAVRSILESNAAPIEVIVLDDASTDRTAEIVRAIASSDRRVRIETAPPLPPGWCGKQHACDVLSRLASHPVLIFLDADVRLKSGAIARMTAFLEQSGAALASGVPEQVTHTFSERLLVPLIHFVLLGFLPIRRMRIDPRPALGLSSNKSQVP
jgi:hypothetical protein